MCESSRVTGSPGTGKTVVALHRTARILDRNPAAKVLLTTFSSSLANALEHRVKVLTSEDPSASLRETSERCQYHQLIRFQTFRA